MSIYAIFQDGGKQYRAHPGDLLKLEKIDKKAGSAHKINTLLLIGGNDSPAIGTPIIKNAHVDCSIVRHGKSPNT